MTTQKIQLTPQQRRSQLVDLLGMAAARMPAAMAGPPREKLSPSRQSCLDASAKMPLSGSVVNTRTEAS